MKKSLALVAGLALTALSQTSQAFPLPTAEQAEAARRLHDPETAALREVPIDLSFLGVDFTAIVALSNCSGSLVRYETSLGSDAAMVLTNGHCLESDNPFSHDFLKPGEVKVDAPSKRKMTLLKPDASTLGKITADRVIYATMTGTDMTLYRLTETFDQLEKRLGVRALTLSSKHPTAATRITIASGYWKRLYSCSIDLFIYQLREADWTFSDSIRYLQPGCETIGGTSGSPIIDSTTLEVIGVNNTGNESGGQCTMNNPCEVDENGHVTVVKQSSYGQQTYWLYSCLEAGNRLNPKKAGCLLPSGK